jgi:LacI family transcriptional regulator
MAIRSVAQISAVGRDIAVTGHDNIHAASFTHPALTTMELDVRGVGETLASKLFSLIDGGPEAPSGEVFPLKQIPRASSGE